MRTDSIDGTSYPRFGAEQSGTAVEPRVRARIVSVTRPAYDGSHLPDADVVLAGDDECRRCGRPRVIVRRDGAAELVRCTGCGRVAWECDADDEMTPIGVAAATGRGGSPLLPSADRRGCDSGRRPNRGGAAPRRHP